MSQAGLSDLTDAALEEGIEDEVDAVDEYGDTEADRREATLGGWKPLSVFRGDPSQWRPAKEYLARGDEVLPFVRKQRDKLATDNETLKRRMDELQQEIRNGDGRHAGELADLRQRMDELLDYSRRAKQEGYEEAKREILARSREAVAGGDLAAYDDAQRELAELDRSDATPPPQRERKNPVPEPKNRIDPAIDDFMASNPWFNSDADLNKQMIAEHNAIIARSPGMPVAQQLEQAKDVVMRNNPVKFGIDPQRPAPRRPAAPLGPRPGTERQRQAATGWEQIEDPRDRREAMTAFNKMNAGLKPSMKPYTVAEYLAIYHNPRADVLEEMASEGTGRKAPPRVSR